MKNRALRLALEGENIEIVEGMFVAVPIGQAEDVRALSTEAFKDSLKEGVKKVIVAIQKAIAGIIGAIMGFFKWATGNSKRGLKKEVANEYSKIRFCKAPSISTKARSRK
jgi:hypothetical protein